MYQLIAETLFSIHVKNDHIGRVTNDQAGRVVAVRGRNKPKCAQRCRFSLRNWILHGGSGVPRVGGGGWVFKAPPPEIPKALQIRAKHNPIVETVKNRWI